MAIDPINFARTTQVRLRRGTTTQIAANPPVEAEPFYDLTSQRMGVGGGSDGIVEQWKSQFLEHTADVTDAVPRNLQDKLTEIVSVKDFGAVGDGVTDDTEAIKMCINSSSGRTVRFVSGEYLVSESIFPQSNSIILLDEDTIIKTSTPNVSIFYSVSKENIVIRGGKLKSTVQGTSGYPSGVFVYSSEFITVENVEFEGMQLAAIYLYDSNNCSIRGNYIHSANKMTNPSADTCDIGVMRNSSDNLVEGNFCYAKTAVGIQVQGSSAETYPLRNKVVNNFVNEKDGYGILAYQISGEDTWILISGNTVEDIIGTHVSGASGSGIYVQTSGGAIVSNNHVRNCCRGTTSASNAPSGISCVSGGASRESIVIDGNHVDAPKYNGIFMGNSSGKFICTNNRVRFDDGTNGTGIILFDASNSIISNNYVEAANSIQRSGILCRAYSVNIENVCFSSNIVNGPDGILFNFTRDSTNTISGTISNNIASSPGSNAQGMSLAGLNKASVSSNILSCGFIGMHINGCTNLRVTGNQCIGSGTYRFLSAGTNSNVFIDDTNDFGTSDTAKIKNQVPGVTIQQRLNSSPSGGNWQIGDRIVQSVPVVGQPKAWVCTIAGSPGTWTSEGNL